MNSFIGLSATEISALVRTGQATAEAVVAQHVARASRVDGDVNMLTVNLRDRAMADARALDARPDKAELPLAGVPVFVKDSIDVKGEMTRCGSRAGSQEIVPHDEMSVARLREAGAVIIGKTTMCELGAWPFTESAAWGFTRNPWSPDRSPGGSSGGCAVAVATASAPLALGADGGGSIRIPAACNGLFGLKPGRGVVPISSLPSANWYGLAEQGPMATTVADAALMLDILAGTVRYRDVKPRENLRIALSLRSPALGVSLDPRIRDAVLATGYALERAGHKIFRADPPYPLTVALPFIRRYLAAIADATDTMNPKWLEKRTRHLAALGRLLRVFGPPCERASACLRGRLDGWFADYDVLICPVTATPPPLIGAWDRLCLSRTLIASTRFMAYTPPFNLAGYPCASVPTGEQVEGVPVGIQLVAPQGGESTLLGLAAHLEQLRPWPRHAPPTGHEGA